MLCLPKTRAHQAGAAIGIGWRHSHYAELLDRRPDLDFVEVHSENFFGAGGAALQVLEQGRAHYAVSLHGVGLSLGSAAGLDTRHLQSLADLVRHIEPVRVSDHASFARGTWNGRTVHAADLLPLPFTDDALQVLCDNVSCVQEVLKRPMLVENLSAYITWNAPPAQAPFEEFEFLNTLARRSGCSLLVDVNNLYVNALNASRGGVLAPEPFDACVQWLNGIDPAHVGELHLAGHTYVQEAGQGIVIDDHGSRVGEPVWRLYEHAIRCFGPVPTLVEWDTDVPALDVLMQEAQQARLHSRLGLPEGAAR